MNWRRLFCAHRFLEYYGDLRADEPGGPRTFHEAYWRCSGCGKLSVRGCKLGFVETIKRERPWEREVGRSV